MLYKLLQSELKYKDHIEFCSNEKTLILMPSKNKYIQFKNIQNTLQLPFVCFADIESYMIVKDEKTEDSQSFKKWIFIKLFRFKIFNKKCKVFDELEDFRDNLINELDYIENINRKSI